MTKQTPISALLETIEKLRSDTGCPWDKKQTFSSLRPFLLEECYEAIDVLDKGEGSKDFAPDLQEELGDVLLQILLHSQIAKEKNLFTFEDICISLNKKLINRHPHVFREQKKLPEKEIHKNWEKQKQKEKNRQSALDDIPLSLPALSKSTKIIKRVSKAGFQWPNLDGPLEKVREELSELIEALETKEEKKIKSELGDLLFCLSNVAFFLNLDAEEALREMLNRFSKRFRHVEKEVQKTGRAMESFSLDELDEFWKQAKSLNFEEEQA